MELEGDDHGISSQRPRPTLVRSKSTPETCAYSKFSNPNDDTTDYITDEFGDLSLQESPPSSFDSLHGTLPYSSCLSPSRLFDDLSLQDTNEAGKKDTAGNVAKKYMTFGNSTKKGGLVPPPISCLKLFKKGKPFSYLNFNEENDSFVPEEIRIPYGDILRANRSDGRLRLYFVISDDECSDMEKEQKEESVKESKINGNIE